MFHCCCSETNLSIRICERGKQRFHWNLEVCISRFSVSFQGRNCSSETLRIPTYPMDAIQDGHGQYYLGVVAEQRWQQWRYLPKSSLGKQHKEQKLGEGVIPNTGLRNLQSFCRGFISSTITIVSNDELFLSKSKSKTDPDHSCVWQIETRIILTKLSYGSYQENKVESSVQKLKRQNKERQIRFLRVLKKKKNLRKKDENRKNTFPGFASVVCATWAWQSIWLLLSKTF